MAKKHRSKQNEKKAPEELGVAWTSPFADLKVDVVAPPEPPPLEQTKKMAGEDTVELSKEDMELLKAFGGDPADLHRSKAERKTEGVVERGYKVTFNIQRKGKGGKTVTLVFGLQALELPEQMRICSEIKTALGTGARFLEGILEIQGDQRDKAAKWFEKKGFQI
ncbi:MAG: translation initiation factor [Lentisphaeria bacterium]